MLLVCVVPRQRRKHAARTLAAFGAALRDETNLDQLTAHLTGVVDETMRPAHVALWLKTEASGLATAQVSTRESQ